MLQKLNEWCVAFNNFSHQDALNGITNGKLIHLISVIYSFVILTFMNQFYSDHASQAADSLPNSIYQDFNEPEQNEKSAENWRNAVDVSFYKATCLHLLGFIIIQNGTFSINEIKQALDAAPDGGGGSKFIKILCMVVEIYACRVMNYQTIF